MHSISKVLFVIIGTMIGAGFASGKEIYNFFVIYGIQGIIGIILSSSIIGYILIKVLDIIEHRNIIDYNKFLEEIASKYSIIKKYPYLLQSIKNIIKIFLLISFYIMVAAFSAYFSQEFSIPQLASASIFATICYIVFIGSIERITKVNIIFIPILIIIIILLAILNSSNLCNISNMQNSQSIFHSIKDAILYSSYNSIMLIPIIIPLKKYINNKKDKKYIGVLSMLILSILAIAVFIIILKVDTNINNIELPTVYVVSKMGNIFKYGYGIVIITAIFTSAISAGYGILENITQNKEKYKNIARCICITSILISKMGFSILVNTMYPIFGILGLIQILFIILY